MHKYSWLRILRTGLSIVFLLLTVILFINPSQWLPPQFIHAVTWLQFTPSLIKFSVQAGIATLGFLVVILITLVFGRIYCAGICPLGTMQDIISWIHRRFFRQKPLKYAKADDFLRYSLLLIALISFLAGTTFLISLLDPFSNFGRIMSNLVRPLFFLGSNGVADFMESRNVFILAKTYYKGFYAASFAYSAVFLLILGWLSWFHGRLFCNTLCPVGSLLGIVSKVSFFRISLDRKACSSCGHCSRVCKAQCIDVKSRDVDISRCVSCFNCLNVCPSGGVYYKHSSVKDTLIDGPVDQEMVNHRRNILRAMLLFSAFITSRAMATRIKGGEKPTTVQDEKKQVPTPPGSESHLKFNRTCTSCHLCISVCPTQVLQPSFLQYGLQGFLQPYMDSHSGFCNFECDLCGQVCPTGAIRPLLPEVKKLTQIGIARFIKENCVVYTDNTDCGACSEHCPTKAVNMVKYRGQLTIPEVNDKICIGCGACEYACPTRPYRAIYVEGNVNHLLAEKPVQEEIKLKKTEEDFPF